MRPQNPIRLDQFASDRAVSISASGSPGSLCLLPGGPFPPLLSNSLRISLSLLLLGKPIAQSNPLRVAFFVPLLRKPIARDTLTAAELLHKAFTDVTVDARVACEVPFQSKLGPLFPG